MPKSKRVRLSTHSKERLSERTNYPDTFFKENVKYAFKNGISLKNLTEEEKHDSQIMRTLWRGCGNGGTNTFKKYYKGYIYVFSHIGNKLVTVYKIDNEEILQKLEKIYQRRHYVKRY